MSSDIAVGIFCLPVIGSGVYVRGGKQEARHQKHKRRGAETTGRRNDGAQKRRGAETTGRRNDGAQKRRGAESENITSSTQASCRSKGKSQQQVIQPADERIRWLRTHKVERRDCYYVIAYQVCQGLFLQLCRIRQERRAREGRAGASPAPTGLEDYLLVPR